MIISQVGSVLLYVITAVTLSSIIEINFIFTFDFFWKLGVIVLTSWLPFYILKVSSKHLNPNDYEKIMRGVGNVNFRFIRTLEN